jgi:sugar phosphate permease
VQFQIRAALGYLVHGLSQLLTLTSLDLVDSEVETGCYALGQLTGLVSYLGGRSIRDAVRACALSTLTALNGAFV